MLKSKKQLFYPTHHEAGKLLGHLSSRGLHLVIDGMQSEENACEMMKLIAKHSKDR